MTRIRTRIDRVGSLLNLCTFIYIWGLIASRNVEQCPGWNHETAIGWRSKISIPYTKVRLYIRQNMHIFSSTYTSLYIRVGPTGFLQSDDDAKLKIDENHENIRPPSDGGLMIPPRTFVDVS